MTVLSGRASRGASSVSRVLLGGLFALLGLIVGGCGSSTLHYGTVVVTVSSDQGPFTGYVAEMTSFYLTQNTGGIGYSYSGYTGLGKTIDFAKLTGTTELFGAPAVVEGTYVSATFSFNFGSAGANYLPAQLRVDVNGQSQAATLVDPASSTGAAPGTITYTVKFDPAQPLVVKGGAPASLDFHFDQSAASLIDYTASPPKVTVRPFMTASTQPLSNKPLRTRGEFVTANKGDGTFTINSVAFFDSPNYTASAQGAIQIQPNDQTTYSVNGVAYRGAAGLAAIAALPINTIVAAYGTLGSLTGQQPVFNATEVYAGLSIENVLQTRVSGTVSSRSGNTFHVRNAELVQTGATAGLSTATGVLVQLLNDVTVNVGTSTVVSVDGQPETASTIQSISVGQQVDLEGAASTTSGVTTVDATAGLVRLTSTPAWGNLVSGQAGSGTVNLQWLGGLEPSAITFTGTGSSSGADADPANYAINTGTIDLSAQPAATLLRFDGHVTAFGSAPPDFTASAVTAGSATEQVLAIEWTGTGTTAPFLSASSSGLVVNIDNAALGTTHFIQTGPSRIDLKNPNISPTIVPDPSATGQFAIGNTATSTGISLFNSFASYLTQINTVLNGTNTIPKLVAVGKWDAATNTFKAYRIDMVEYQ